MLLEKYYQFLTLCNTNGPNIWSFRQISSSCLSRLIHTCKASYSFYLQQWSACIVCDSPTDIWLQRTYLSFIDMQFDMNHTRTQYFSTQVQQSLSVIHNDKHSWINFLCIYEISSQDIFKTAAERTLSNRFLDNLNPNRKRNFCETRGTQGSVLRQLLFLVMVTDLRKVLCHLSLPFSNYINKEGSKPHKTDAWEDVDAEIRPQNTFKRSLVEILFVHHSHTRCACEHTSN